MVAKIIIIVIAIITIKNFIIIEIIFNIIAIMTILSIILIVDNKLLLELL